MQWHASGPVVSLGTHHHDQLWSLGLTGGCRSVGVGLACVLYPQGAAQTYTDPKNK